MKASGTPLSPLKFSPTVGRDFSSTLKKRVRAYFKENDISRNANADMVIKTIFMISLYFVPYILILTGVLTGPWLILLGYILMGFGMAGIGLSIMHDANHGAYSKKDRTNKYIGRIINLVGGYAPTWKIQHNVLHHTYTNIFGYDEDIAPAISILRFSPDDEHNKAHRFQYIFAWFFYGLMTFMWITTKDFTQLYRYKKMGLTKIESEKFRTLIAELIISKIFYYAYVVVLPILVLDISWWLIAIYVFIMHYVASLILGTTFQPGHIVPETKFINPDKDDMTVENNWMIHQMETTSNYAPGSRWFSWLIGGINFQVEHHLFPNICHVHYKKLSKIVKSTAEEFNVPYNSHRTFGAALLYHTKMLKSLGRS